MRRILCFLGLHRWTVYMKRKHYLDRVCTECGHGEIIYNHRKDKP